MIFLIVIVIAVLALWAVIEFWTRWRLAQIAADDEHAASKSPPGPEPENTTDPSPKP